MPNSNRFSDYDNDNNSIYCLTYSTSFLNPAARRPAD